MKELEFFSAWFCPYAQRAWIALEHHKLPFKKLDGLLPDQPGTDFVGYIKNPRLLELNPKGLVPTISEGEGTPPVYESLFCIEYADELAKAVGSPTPSLFPGTPAERASLRVKADWVNRKCCSPFYQVLVRSDQKDREQGLADLIAGIDELEEMAKASSGPYLMGKQMTAVDIAFIPWAHRIMVCKVFDRFRGPKFAIDMTKRPHLSAWLDTVMNLPAVQATLADTEALSDTYKRYADGTAQSQVGEALRQGKAADSV